MNGTPGGSLRLVMTVVLVVRTWAATFVGRVEAVDARIALLSFLPLERLVPRQQEPVPA